MTSRLPWLVVALLSSAPATARESPAQLGAALWQQLTLDAALDTRAIHIEVRPGGVVVLTGEVPSEDARHQVARVARGLPGVASVDNGLSVAPASFDDHDVARAVELALLRDYYLDTPLSVEVRDGIVYLRGRVDWALEKQRAAEIALQIPGVRGVDNSITLDLAVRTDAELAWQVSDELAKHPFVDDTGISVTVERGVVSLNGTVASRFSRAQAEEVAWEAGAKAVHNLLEVPAP